jgi:hypothetical protein
MMLKLPIIEMEPRTGTTNTMLAEYNALFHFVFQVQMYAQAVFLCGGGTASKNMIILHELTGSRAVERRGAEPLM